METARPNHDAGQACVCVTDHRPTPLELNHHHVWPLEYGGPSVPDNMVWLCPTGHVNVHEILRDLIRNGGVLSEPYWHANRYLVGLARRGYEAAKAAGAI